ncbi:hypothetical protein A2U01_0066315, partial [Trifolium medium]|nr:hypothetical protein [Trifolium medium]
IDRLIEESRPASMKFKHLDYAIELTSG